MKSMMSSHLWISRYCKRALQRRPALSQSTVIRRAIAAYPYANGMGPEEAAELYSSLSDLRERNSSGLRQQFDGSRVVAPQQVSMR